MKERQIKLINHLLQHPNEYFTIETLKGILVCSEKTVRNDLNKIDDFLQESPHINLIRKRGQGITLRGEKAALVDLYQTINHTPVLSANERLIALAYQLLTAREAMPLKKFQAARFTHAAAIKADFETLAPWFQKFQLTIASVQGKGTFLQGEELDKRNALANLSELMTDDNFNILDFFEPSEYDIVRFITQQIQEKYTLHLTDGSFNSLILHALVLIKRTRQNYTIKMPEEKSDLAKKSQAYEIAVDFLKGLEEKINIRFPENEIIYFSWHISSSLRKNLQQAELDISHDHALKITRILMEKVTYYTQINFLEDDMLEDSIFIHMESVLKRLHYGFHISNPMLHEIKKLYPYMMSMIIFALKDIKANENLYIPEAEAGFLVLHFQAALERMEDKMKNQVAIVICHLGIGMSRLLEAKLKQQYKGITILDCLAKLNYDNGQVDLSGVDFIISTVPLSHPEKPMIEISPLLTTEDKRKLNQFLQEKKQTLAYKELVLLKKLVENGLFQIDLNLTHAYKIIERLSQQLTQLDKVKPEFTHQALLRERTSSTAIGGKIAIPHAAPHLVTETTISVGILKSPLAWGSESVSLVFLLAISESDRHLTRQLLKEISLLSAQPDLIEKLIQSKNKTAFLTALT